MSDRISLHHLQCLSEDSEKETAQVLSTVSKDVSTMSKQSCNIASSKSIILLITIQLCTCIYMRMQFVTLDKYGHAYANAQKI